MEMNDIYDKNRSLTGRLHKRGTPWKPGEYGLVVCVWVYDGAGHLLLTRRAQGKSYAGTWENSGGAAKAGETSRQAIVRELFEETGIRAEQEEFELLDSGRDRNCFYDFYCLKRSIGCVHWSLVPLIVPVVYDVVAVFEAHYLLRLIDADSIGVELPYDFAHASDFLDKTLSSCDEKVAL